MLQIKMDDAHKEENRQTICELLDFTVKSLMETRRVCELDGIMTLEEFDEKLNELSEKWYQHFRDKSLNDIMTKRLIDILIDSLGGNNGD